MCWLLECSVNDNPRNRKCPWTRSFFSFSDCRMEVFRTRRSTYLDAEIEYCGNCFFCASKEQSFWGITSPGGSLDKSVGPTNLLTQYENGGKRNSFMLTIYIHIYIYSELSWYFYKFKFDMLNNFVVWCLIAFGLRIMLMLWSVLSTKVLIIIHKAS